MTIKFVFWAVCIIYEMKFDQNAETAWGVRKHLLFSKKNGKMIVTNPKEL